MHIPDGFISLPVNLSLGATSVVALGYSLRQSRIHMEDRHMPLMGVTAAFVFAAQMLNFPVGAGTSGHFLGAFLTMVLVGPFPGMVVMATVLTLQALLFGDGGISALGTNVFNMAIVGGMLPWLGFRFTLYLLRGRSAFVISGALFAWFSVLLAALAAAVELSISGLLPLKLSLYAMGGVHSLIGLGEAVITGAALSLLITRRPDLVSTWKPTEEHPC
ncbi:energy-coupling factor ABC transporter permease [Myxococcota bacterium]|nr:energy-coupling factor ABC transporter permease [Myxococcota bacterium]